jgi:uncharacterized protein (TIGR03382 family)
LSEVNTFDVDMELQSADGATVGDVAETATGVIARGSNLPAGDLFVRVTPRGARIEYNLSVRCSPGETGGGPLGFGSCTGTQVGKGAPWAAILLAGALLRRRRRG